MHGNAETAMFGALSMQIAFERPSVWKVNKVKEAASTKGLLKMLLMVF